jgi:hypothetical protein
MVEGDRTAVVADRTAAVNIASLVVVLNLIDACTKNGGRTESESGSPSGTFDCPDGVRVARNVSITIGDLLGQAETPPGEAWRPGYCDPTARPRDCK